MGFGCWLIVHPVTFDLVNVGGLLWGVGIFISSGILRVSSLFKGIVMACGINHRCILTFQDIALTVYTDDWTIVYDFLKGLTFSDNVSIPADQLLILEQAMVKRIAIFIETIAPLIVLELALKVANFFIQRIEICSSTNRHLILFKNAFERGIFRTK